MEEKAILNLLWSIVIMGALGGEEDEDYFELDLCDKCSSDLSYKMKNWLKSGNNNKS